MSQSSCHEVRGQSHGDITMPLLVGVGLMIKRSLTVYTERIKSPLLFLQFIWSGELKYESYCY